jgi:hypothetical protein
MRTMADVETRLKSRDLNGLIRYTMWSVFGISGRAVLDGDSGAAGIMFFTGRRKPPAELAAGLA